MSDMDIGWGNYRAIIDCADLKDSQLARGERHIAGRQLKHKWTAVKLASAGKDVEQSQTPASAQAAVDRFRALSPASQEALLRQYELGRYVTYMMYSALTR